MSVSLLEIVLYIYSSYFLHVHLHWWVHFNFVFMHLPWEQVIGQVHFTYRWNTSLTRGIIVQIGSRHRHVGCCPDTRFEDTLFEMLIKCILSWWILSTSLIVCENNLIRTRSNIIGFDRFVLVQPTDKLAASSFSLVDAWNRVSTIVANCINMQQDRLHWTWRKYCLIQWIRSKCHGFAHCRAQICGDSVKGYHFLYLSRFQGGPDFRGQI